MKRLPNLDDWVPSCVHWKGAEPWVDWCYLGERRFEEPFFSHTIEACLAAPANLLFRHQTPINKLEELFLSDPGLEPGGFIFHMSRCGSTLLARMLQSLPTSLVLSEAEPIDAVLTAHVRHPDMSEQRRAQWLQWIVSALCRRRSSGERRAFIKFDSWHTLYLPLLRQVFPCVPSVFLFRDPIEVMVSHARQPGSLMIPGATGARLLCIDPAQAAAMPVADYCACVLDTICSAALIQFQPGLDAFVNYRELPEIAHGPLARHFGLELSAVDVKNMQCVAGFDAKSTSQVFRPDSTAKQLEAGDAVKQAALRVQPLYAEMERRKLEPDITS